MRDPVRISIDIPVGHLIDQLGGELIRGSRDHNLNKVCGTSSADRTSLVFGEDAASVNQALQSEAGAAAIAHGISIPDNCQMAVIEVSQPRLWFARAARLLLGNPPVSGIDPTAVIAPDAILGEEVSIGPCATIGPMAVIGARTRIEAGASIGDRVQIGEDCRIHPRVVLYHRVRIGSRVIVHAGAVLGADGFGYVRDRETGAYTQFPQIGELIVEDDVEIGANTTIDRGALRETRIRRGVKIDNLVHIGHNCDIGEDVVMASLTGISGSSSVGKGAILAGQVGVGDHAHIGPGVILGGQAGILSGKTINTQGSVLWGTPAKPLREYLRELATLSRLARRKKE